MVSIRQKRRRILIAALVVLLVAGTIAGLYMTNHLPFFHRAQANTAPLSVNPATKGEPAPTQQTGTTGASDKGQGSTTNTNAVLIAPFGNFVSNHHPTLSDSPSGSGYITSTCTTTPGAKCQIVFTKDGVSKSLSAETTDAGGTAYWNNWKVSDYLTAGTWTVQAVATLGSQTMTVADTLSLVVSQ